MQLDFSNVQLIRTSVHQVGNSLREEELILSQEPLQIESEMIKALLMKFFLSPFKSPVLYNLSGTDEENRILANCREIFQDKNNREIFHLYSKSLAGILYSKSDLPQIKSGELYVAYFMDCVLDDELVDAIGIFKSEHKDTYLKVNAQEGENLDSNFAINYDSGLNINNLDKGCLIFNTDSENGFAVSIFDNSNNKFWKDTFLKVKERADSHYYTKNYLELCKDFINNGGEENPVEQLENTQKLLQYFKENKDFDLGIFEEEVIIDEKKLESFRAHKAKFEEEHEIQMPTTFEIASAALKKEKLAQEINLDNKVLIKIKNTNVLVRRGFDELLGQKFLQFFYDEEK